VGELCDFAMQVVAGISSPFIFALSYYSESKVLKVMGIGFLRELLSGLAWAAEAGLYIQLTQFSVMILVSVLQHLMNLDVLDLSQHVLTFLQLFIQYIIPSFLAIELPLLAFTVHAK
jgi:hypothetical protein